MAINAIAIIGITNDNVDDIALNSFQFSADRNQVYLVAYDVENCNEQYILHDYH